jgi:hypothetical protein
VPPVGELRKAAESSSFLDLLVGTPDDAIKQIEAMESYSTHLALGLALPGIDPKKIRSSMKLFADKVIPHFRKKSRKKAG